MDSISYIHDVDLAQFATLVAIVEEGTLSAAARRRHLTQPAVSLQLKALETELGARLLHRDGKRATLTRAGEAVVRQARAALAAARAARAEVEEIRGLVRGSLLLGVTDAAATEILPAAFVAFHRIYPGIEVAVEVHGTGPLLERLRDGRVDLALGTLPVEDPDVTATPLLTERLGIVAPAAARGTAARKLLEREPFIAYPRRSVTRSLVDAALAKVGLSVRPVMEIGQPAVSVRLVEAGLGVSVLPEAVFRSALDRGTVVRVAPARFRVVRRLGMLRSNRREPEPAARALAKVLLPGGT